MTDADVELLSHLAVEHLLNVRKLAEIGIVTSDPNGPVDKNVENHLPRNVILNDYALWARRIAERLPPR